MSKLKNTFIKNNPIFVMALGLCPTLAVTTSLDNSIGMSLATVFVLLMSGFFVSSMRKVVPKNVRIPLFIIIIATFVTIAQLFMKAYSPHMNANLGIFVPLIVVNCIILGRAEAFASKNPIGKSLWDAITVGIGFTFALVVIGSIRELIGTGKLFFFGTQLIDYTMAVRPFNLFILAPGALLTIGLLMAFFNWIGNIDWKKQSANVAEHEKKVEEASGNES